MTDPHPSTGFTSYHVHTKWSDGAETVASTVARAAALDLDEVGISDHFVLHPSGVALEWSMPTERLDEYTRDVMTVAASAPLPVRLGIESDFIPETAEETIRRLDRCPFDYRIGSVHFIDGFPVDEHSRFWEGLSQEEADDKWRDYYRRVILMAQSGGFDIVAHLDLPKKFGRYPVADLSADARHALDAIRDSGMAMELNTSGRYQTAREAYPSPWHLREAKRRGIPVLITADAHNPANLNRDFRAAADLLREAGYTEVTRFSGREQIRTPLG